MRLAVVSFFRNAEGLQAARFLDQVAALRDECNFHVHVNAVHGDCVDRTAEFLLCGAEKRNLNLQLIECSHGGPVFGSTEHEDRLTALSKVGNAGLDSISKEDDFVFYVESDLIWSPNVVLELLRQVRTTQPSVLAPLVFAGKNFYDIFCYRKNGKRFGPFYPYHEELKHDGTWTIVDSIGSCFVMHAEVGRNCRIRHNNVLLGFCEDAWAHGYPIFVQSSLRVDHPA